MHTLGTTWYARLSQRVGTATGTSRLTSREHRALAQPALSSGPGKAELVAFRVAEHQVVVVFRRYARTEFCEPFQLVRDAITSQVQMDAVLHDLWLGY